MAPGRVVIRLILVFLTAATCAVASRPPGIDSPGPAKSSAIKSLPFSADVITEYDGTLDNGGHIHRQSPGRIFRDSQGRMRTESQSATCSLGVGKCDYIVINDPIRQVIIYLNPRDKTAAIVHFGELGQTAPVASDKQPNPKETATVRMGGGGGIHSGPTHALGLQEPSGGQAKPASVLTPTGTAPKTDAISTGSAAIMPLGNKIMEGVNVIGTRTTRTISAGTIGNDTPIVSISDTWVCSDLKITMLTETDDGQGGHSTMRLEHIVRREPKAALFRIPRHYTVKENALVGTSK